jgi:hypothetical protein
VRQYRQRSPSRRSTAGSRRFTIASKTTASLAWRSFFDTIIDGATKKHFIFSLNVDTGAINPGWPVDVNASATYNGMTFTSSIQNQRAALGLVNGVVYATGACVGKRWQCLFA